MSRGRVALFLGLAVSLALGAAGQHFLHAGIEEGGVRIALGAMLVLAALARRTDGPSAVAPALALTLSALLSVALYPPPPLVAHLALAVGLAAWFRDAAVLPLGVLLDHAFSVAWATALGARPSPPQWLVPLAALVLLAHVASPGLASGPGPARWRVTASLGLGLLLILDHATRWRAGFGGVDFFWIACEARDAALGPANPDPGRFDHMPGEMRLWSTAIEVLGDRLEPLQWVFMGVVAANLALVAAVVRRATGDISLGLAAALLSYVCDSRLELFEMTSERLASLPWLLAAWLWIARPAGAGRAARVLAIGACLGLMVYVRRQATAPAVAAIAWMALDAGLLHGPRVALRTAGLATLATLAAVLLPVLAEGDGLLPIRFTLWTLVHHPTQGSFLSNAVSVLARAPVAFLAPAAAVAALGRLLRASRAGTAADPALARQVSLVGFLAPGATLTIAQFARAAYAHHALFLATASVASVAVLARRLAPHAAAARGRPLVLACGAVGVSALLGASRDHMGFPELPPPDTRRELTRISSALAAHVRPGEDLLVLPPGNCELWFRFGALARHGPVAYTWMGHVSEPLARRLDWTKVDVAAVFSGVGHGRDWAAYHGSDGLAAELPARGFRPVASSGGVTLWRRRTD